MAPPASGRPGNRSRWQELDGQDYLVKMYHRVYVQVDIYKIDVNFFISYKLTCYCSEIFQSISLFNISNYRTICVKSCTILQTISRITLA